MSAIGAVGAIGGFLLVGLAVGVVAERGLRSTLAAPVFARTNFRQRDVVIGLGLVHVFGLLVVAAVVAVGSAVAFDVGSPDGEFARFYQRAATFGYPVVVVASGFGLLGLLDDLGAHGDARGFRGHLREMASGRFSTGSLKLGGGGLLALVVAAALDSPTGTARVGVVGLLRDALLIALAANVANLFDRRPGRVAKVALVVAGVAVAGGFAGGMAPSTEQVWWWLATLCGLLVATLAPDLGERAMLGDTGSNVIGAVFGVAAVATLSGVGRWAALVLVLALNAASEKVSFSRVFDSVAALRAFDRWGREPLD